jgi:EamA domain-containing membrane protein RarD
MAQTSASRGLAAAIAAFVMWGLFPLYLIGLMQVSAMQITAHRIVWSCVFVLAWLAAIGELGKLRQAVSRLRNPSDMSFWRRGTCFAIRVSEWSGLPGQLGATREPHV